MARRQKLQTLKPSKKLGAPINFVYLDAEVKIVAEDRFFGRSNPNTSRIELALVLVFVVIGCVILAFGLIDILYEVDTGFGFASVLFGVLFLFASYALAVQFGFLERFYGIYTGP